MAIWIIALARLARAWQSWVSCKVPGQRLPEVLPITHRLKHHLLPSFARSSDVVIPGWISLPPGANQLYCLYIEHQVPRFYGKDGGILVPVGQQFRCENIAYYKAKYHTSLDSEFRGTTFRLKKSLWSGKKFVCKFCLKVILFSFWFSKTAFFMNAHEQILKPSVQDPWNKKSGQHVLSLWEFFCLKSFLNWLFSQIQKTIL